MKLFLSIILSLNLTAAIAAPQKTYWGEEIQVGNGHAQSYIKMKHGRLEEIGVALTAGGLINLPAHEMKEHILPMPAGVRVSPYKHITFDWNPHGHEPDGVYDKPHFDIHFYFITNVERQAITCTNEDAAICMQTLLPEYLVSDYAPTPAGVPRMGWHWVDLLSPEFNGGIFTRTFIYGYYAGKPTFLEPMVTLEYLQSKEKSILEIRRPAVFPYPDGHFPREYRVYYDKKHKLHKIVLRRFSQQD